MKRLAAFPPTIRETLPAVMCAVCDRPMRTCARCYAMGRYYLVCWAHRRCNHPATEQRSQPDRWFDARVTEDLQSWYRDFVVPVMEQARQRTADHPDMAVWVEVLFGVLDQADVPKWTSA